jgi:hypothetical protein
VDVGFLSCRSLPPDLHDDDDDDGDDVCSIYVQGALHWNELNCTGWCGLEQRMPASDGRLYSKPHGHPMRWCDGRELLELSQVLT